jgi:hypothetical protein
MSDRWILNLYGQPVADKSGKIAVKSITTERVFKGSSYKVIRPAVQLATLARIAEKSRKAVFDTANRSSVLPVMPYGYYTRIRLPNRHGDGNPYAFFQSERVITGGSGEIYYTPNHYLICIRLNPGINEPLVHADVHDYTWVRTGNQVVVEERVLQLV